VETVQERRESEKRELQDSSSFSPSLLLRLFPQRNFLSVAGSFSLAMASQFLWVSANFISCPFCVSSSSISGWFAVNHDELFSNSSNGEKMMMMCPKLSCCCL
jgi:hypothetical protein